MNARRSIPILVATISLGLLATSSLYAQQPRSHVTSSNVVPNVGSLRPKANFRISGVVAWPAASQGQPTSPNPCSKVTVALFELKAPVGLGGQQPARKVVAVPEGTNCRYTFEFHVAQGAPDERYNIETTYTGTWSQPASLVSGRWMSGVPLPVTVYSPGGPGNSAGLMVNFQLVVSLLKWAPTLDKEEQRAESREGLARDGFSAPLCRAARDGETLDTLALETTCVRLPSSPPVGTFVPKGGDRRGVWSSGQPTGAFQLPRAGHSLQPDVRRSSPNIRSKAS